MSPNRRSAAQHSAKLDAADAAPLLLPPEPPVEEVLGRPVLKDFVDEETREIRPFKGFVRRRYKSDGRWVLQLPEGAIKQSNRAVAKMQQCV